MTTESNSVEPLDREREETYRARIQGQPGAGAAEFVKILAVVQGIAGVGAAMLTLETSFAMAVGLATGGLAAAALCYCLAIVVENVIVIRVETEFQSEMIEQANEEEADQTAH